MHTWHVCCRGNLGAFADTWLPFPEAIADAIRTHPDDNTRHFLANQLMTCMPYDVVVDNEYSKSGSRSLCSLHVKLIKQGV